MRGGAETLLSLAAPGGRVSALLFAQGRDWKNAVAVGKAFDAETCAV
jgi:hypothetical protein